MENKEILATQTEYGQIIGVSRPMKELFMILEKITNTVEPILIEGETGTGKEMVARNIVARENRPFIPIDCGALMESLAESELFGHCKGAFTGALYNKAGLFEEMNGGTIFLDEIENLAPSIQAKLLRVLEEKEIRRVGEKLLRKIDIQVIASTNVDLAREVTKGHFRRDLYYRLNVIHIKLPPLRERSEDIPLLSHHFLSQCCNKINKKINGFSQEALSIFTRYSWPGNIRELRNVITRIVLLVSENGIIGVDLLPDEIVEKTRKTRDFGRTLKSRVEELEKILIIKELKRQNWNISHAAQALGLTRRGLKQKMARYGFKKN